MPKRGKKAESKKRAVSKPRPVKHKNTIKKAPVKKLVTVPEFAKTLGITARAVQLAIGKGKVTATKSGRTFRLDLDVAKREWLENCHSKSKGSKNVRDAEKMTLHEAERREKVAKAKLAELKYAEARGRVVDSERVRRQAFEMGRKIRDAMLRIPNRISAEVMSQKKQFDVEQIMTREITEVLKLLSNAK